MNKGFLSIDSEYTFLFHLCFIIDQEIASQHLEDQWYLARLIFVEIIEMFA